MGSHWELSDKEFKDSFEQGTLSPGLFNHEAHLRLAWIHIEHHGISKALDRIPKQLKHYVAGIGAADKYNETLTIAAIRAVYHFMLKTPGGDFGEFIREHPRLKTHFREIIDSHYSNDIFSDPQARMEYFEPDILPFDAFR